MKLVVPPEAAGTRLDRFLATCEPVGWDDPASYLALVMPLRLVD